jgi:Class II vitamin B12-dependent ribonucleotide reductase
MASLTLDPAPAAQSSDAGSGVNDGLSTCAAFIGATRMSETITHSGLSIHRHFTLPYAYPYEQIDWERRDAIITNAKGESVFEQRNVEIPTSWSQTAANIVASKYFHGKLESPGRENSVRQLIDRVVNTITENGYFQSPEDAEDFKAEFTFVLVNHLLMTEICGT